MRLIDADELLIAMDTWDKFGYDEQERLIPIGNDDERYVPYVHYADMVKAVNGMPTVDARADAKAEVIDEILKYYECSFGGLVVPVRKIKQIKAEIMEQLKE